MTIHVQLGIYADALCNEEKKYLHWGKGTENTLQITMAAIHYGLVKWTLMTRGRNNLAG